MLPETLCMMMMLFIKEYQYNGMEYVLLKENWNSYSVMMMMLPIKKYEYNDTWLQTM